MKNVFTLLFAVLVSTVAFGQKNACDKSGKVLVCHIPPGNPENAHEICISENGVPAHLAHGCYVGYCNPGDNTKLDGQHIDENFGDYVTVYPNPVQNVMSFEMVFPEDTKAEISIYDMRGTLVAKVFDGMADSSFIMNWNAEQLAAGIYVVRVTTPSKMHVFKMNKS
ncbi:MAG: T9SS type A sorting domain-containing protein [Flavobacteriales bacterium]|nr:T9SS type A sorting domain-containing protein [Flavobacteriales bacterium]